METWKLILLVYGAVVLAGGLMGWVKAKSTPSLIAGGVFGVVLMGLAFCPVGNRVGAWVAAILTVIMGVRFVKTRKFMPAGLVAILSVIVAAVLFLRR